VATLAREDGRPPRLWGDYRALAEVAQAYEARFGLRSTAGRDDHAAARRPGVKEAVTAERAGRTPPRDVLRGKVKAAAAASRGFAEFTEALAGAGATVWPRMSERTPDRVTGYAVSLDGWTNGTGEPVRFGGGRLAPDLTLPKLRARWQPASPEPAPAAEAERVWREAERIVREAADRIAADAGSDPDGAADAAWAAGDTLAAAGVEGDAGGPLSEAAAAFDRAGRESYRRIPALARTDTALRSAARMMALLAPGTQHSDAQVATLTVALAALVAAVADLRAAQHRLHQAEAARASAARLRRVAPVPTPPAAGDPTAACRPRTAAEIASLSFAAGPFRMPRTAPTGRTKPEDGPSQRGWTPPEQGRGRGPSRWQSPGRPRPVASAGARSMAMDEGRPHMAPGRSVQPACQWSAASRQPRTASQTRQRPDVVRTTHR